MEHHEEDMRDIAQISVKLADETAADSSYLSLIINSEQTLSAATLNAMSAGSQPSKQIVTEAVRKNAFPDS